MCVYIYIYTCIMYMSLISTCMYTHVTCRSLYTYTCTCTCTHRYRSEVELNLSGSVDAVRGVEAKLVRKLPGLLEPEAVFPVSLRVQVPIQ